MLLQIRKTYLEPHLLHVALLKFCIIAEMQVNDINMSSTLVLPILTYGLAVYGASDSDLNVIQHFLDRCHKRHFTSQTVSFFNLLEQQDKSAFKRAIDNHMLGAIIPKDKELVYNLRRRRCHLPQIKTERYKKTFVNRLILNLI